MSLAWRLLFPVIQKYDAEDAHRLAIAGLKHLPLWPKPVDDPRLSTSVFGLDFPNPIGLAAGFDKNAEVPEAMLKLGFGFVEIGTVTPQPQPGNARPRIFRLPADEAVINRLGFNNEGHDAAHRRLSERDGKSGLIGVNVGANKDSPDRVSDYVKGIRRFADLASYFTVNISSPNTPGLRDLQQKDALDDLLAWTIHERDEASRVHGRKPVLLKIAPDLTLGELDDIVSVCKRRGIEGMIVSNTTVKRPRSLVDRNHRFQVGGLSGKPLFPLSTRMLAETYLRVERQFPLIGAGGIDSARAAFSKMEAGASLVQLYSGLIYKGPTLARDIAQGLVERMDKDKVPSLASIVGRSAKDWQEWPIEGVD